jgi:hypothetical protein
MDAVPRDGMNKGVGVFAVYAWAVAEFGTKMSPSAAAASAMASPRSPDTPAAARAFRRAGRR